jgi:DNA replication and repair protein RecF
MHLTATELVDFRSYKHASISFEPGVNLILGDNGQGKTNLLEAVGLLSVGRSIRGASDSDMVAWDASEARIEVSAHDAAATRICMALHPGGSKSVTIDGAEAGSLSELVGKLRSVQITPDMIDHSFRSPSGRRRMLDMLISQFDRVYLDALRRHRAVVRNINAAYKRQSSQEAELSVWEQQLAEVAIEITRIRVDVLAELNVLAVERFSTLFGGTDLEFRIQPTLPLDDASSVAEQIESAAEALLIARERGLRMGYVTKGAHRDRLSVLIRDRDIEQHASQGQIKGAYFAWKFAEGDVIEQRTSSGPIWLVDDPFSEMDRGRATTLLDTLRERGQVIMTTARDDDLKLSEYGFPMWRVYDGTLERMS